MIKSIEREKGCFAKAGEDEPLFVLRSTDKLAPHLVRLWAHLLQDEVGETDKTRSAFALAEEMKTWAAEYGSKTPD